MISTVSEPTVRKWTATELRSLDSEQRDAILSQAAEWADEDYANDCHLTAFEAFAEEDLYGRSSNTQSR